MKHLTWKLFGAAFALAVVFDILFYKSTNLGLNVFLMEIIALGSALAIAHAIKHKIPLGAWIAAAFGTLFALTFVIWTSALGLTLSGFGLFGANFFFAAYLLGHHGKFHHPAHVAIDGIRYGAETVFTRLSILGSLTIPNMSLRNSAVLRGVLIAIPILLIFIALFLGSDLVLQQKSEGFLDWLDEAFGAYDIIAHIFIIVSVGLSFLLLFASAFWKRIKIDELKQLAIKHNIESAVILAGANILFIAFILFQGVYLFGGQAAWDQIDGITYSEYAVSGFNELATVAVLVVLLILTLRFYHTEKTNRKLVLWLEIALLIETLAIVFSAWTRMSLYVEQYAYSPARLFGFWFFITTGLGIALLAYHIYKRTPQFKFIQQGAILLGVSMLVFTAMAPDALSVRLNIAQAEDGHIDPFPLFNELSAEAYPMMVYVLNNADFDIGLASEEIESLCEEGYTEEVSMRLYDDALIRQDIVNFSNRWGHDRHYRFPRFEGGTGDKLVHHGWREFNFSRIHLPSVEQSGEYLDPFAVPSGEERFNAACGLVAPTDKDFLSTESVDDRR